MNEEALKMYAELTQEVSLCQDEDIKALGKGILKLANNYDKSLKEIERLNIIISNLEIYVRKRIELCYELGCTQEQFDIWNSIEMRIKELKGSDKE